MKTIIEINEVGEETKVYVLEGADMICLLVCAVVFAIGIIYLVSQ